MTNNEEIEKEIKNILYTINSLGYIAYIVGGAVRDKMLGLPINDYDICTNMPLDKVKELYPKFHIMKQNANRQVGVLNILGTQTEIAKMKGQTIIEDLMKRDFTINTIIEDATGIIYDYLLSANDLNNHLIKLVNPNGETFKEDPTRILRAIRLSSKLGFTIDKNCYQQMLIYRKNLSTSTPEKVYNELKKILSGQYLPQIINNLKPFILEIIPEIKNKDYYNICNMIKESSNDYLLRLFILLNSCSSSEIASFTERLKVDKKTTKYLQAFLKYKNKLLSSKAKQINYIINQYSITFLIALFHYQEISFKIEMNQEGLVNLYKIEKIYFQAISNLLSKNLTNLQVNPILFTTIPNMKVRLIVESDVIKNIRNHKLKPSEKEIKEYLLLKS